MAKNKVDSPWEEHFRISLASPCTHTGHVHVDMHIHVGRIVGIE